MKPIPEQLKQSIFIPQYDITQLRITERSNKFSVTILVKSEISFILHAISDTISGVGSKLTKSYRNKLNELRNGNLKDY